MRQFTIVAGWIFIAAMVAVPMSARAAEPAADELDLARQRLVSFEWQDAYTRFMAVADSEKSGSDRWVQATFGAAVAQSQRQPQVKENMDDAVRLYNQILQSASRSPYVPRAMMNIARLKELRDFGTDVPDLDGARELYLKIIADYPGDPIAGEAAFRAAAALIQQYDEKQNYAKVKQGIAELEKWLADHPQEELASAMWQYVGDTYFFPLDDAKNAMVAYDKADALGWTDKGNEGMILWRCAVLSEQNNNLPSAIRYYTKIIKEAPNSGKAYESQVALKRLGAPVPEINILRGRKAPTTQAAGVAK